MSYRTDPGVSPSPADAIARLAVHVAMLEMRAESYHAAGFSSNSCESADNRAYDAACNLDDAIDALFGIR